VIIPKVNSLDHHGIPFVMLDAGNLLKQIFDIAMTPISTFNGRDGRNVWNWSISTFPGWCNLEYLLPAPKACAWVVKRMSAISTINRTLLDDNAIL